MTALVSKIARCLSMLCVPGLMLLSCDSSSESEVVLSRQAADWWPYQVGDTYSQIDLYDFFKTPIVYHVIKDTQMGGMTWSMHVSDPHPQMTNEHSPEPGAQDTSYFRVDGQLLYWLHFGDSILFSFDPKYAGDVPGYHDATWVGTSTVQVSAGTFPNAVTFEAPGNVFMKYSFAQGAGWIHSSDQYGDWELVRATIGGKQYP